jgi:hypothetical protein
LYNYLGRSWMSLRDEIGEDRLHHSSEEVCELHFELC